MEICDKTGLFIGLNRDGSPIWLVQGGAPDDDDDGDDDGIDVGGDDDDEDADGEDGEDNSEDGEDEDDKTPPAKKAPAKKVAAKAPARRDPTKKGPNYDAVLASERTKRKAAERQLAALRLANETDVEKRNREANEAAEERYKPVAVRAAARAALVEAKVKGDPGRAVKLMNLADIDIDEDGETIGLDDQIALIVAEFPEMFDIVEDDSDDTKRRRKPPAKINPGNRKPDRDNDGKKLTSAQRIEQMVNNGEL